MPYIEAAEQRGIKPEEALADTICGGDENHEAAKAKDVDLIAPALDKRRNLFRTLTDFEFSENGAVSSCPENCRPVKISRKKDKFSIAFASETCGACPRVNHCPVKPGKKKFHYLRYSEKNVRLAQRRAYERTDDLIFIQLRNS